MSGALLLMQAAGLFSPRSGYGGLGGLPQRLMRVEQENLDGTCAKIFEGSAQECKNYIDQLHANPLYAGCKFNFVSNYL